MALSDGVRVTLTGRRPVHPDRGYVSMKAFVRAGLSFALLAVVLFAGAAPVTANTSGTGIVISQVYGGGGNTSAPFTNDFVELFNPTTTTMSLTGMSVQYASASGTGNFAANGVVALSGSIAPGHHYLVQQAGGATGSPLPTPDATGTVNMSATAGKVVVASTTTGLACNGGSTPCDAGQLAQIVDLVGYGSANFFEGAGAAPTLSNTTAGLRAANGCTDTDSNAADFTAGAPAPRNTASAATPCSSSTNPSGTGTASPATVAPGGSTLFTVAVTPGAGPPSTGLAATVDLSSIGGSSTQSLFDDGSHGDATAGDGTFSFGAIVGPATAPGSKTLPVAITDTQNRSGSVSIALTVEGPLLEIHDIQGAAHISPHNGQVVSTNGIVTARSTNGFWMQDPTPDADVATSEGVFVFTSSSPGVAVGDAVHVNARVQEFRPGSATNANLTTTELASPTVTVQSTGNPLPAPVVVGAGGRVPPNQVIEDDATGSVETSGVFDPATDGLDFWESLEGMRVQLNNPVAVGPTNAFGETEVVGDNGAGALVRTPRGGVLARPDNFNPERVVVDDLLVPTPTMNVGDHYLGAVVGVLDYNFGTFFLEATSVPAVAHDGVTPETTDTPAADQLAVATFNVENLAPSDPQSKFDRLAGLILHNLAAPDVISVEEVQDNSGATDDGTVAAEQTLAKLVAAISAAGGPAYDWRGIDPVNDQDGGQPGGNIRQVFLFRTDRGLSFVDRPGGTSTAADSVVGSGASTQLAFSPGRIAPADTAWSASRKPLAGEFMFHGHHLFVIANHFDAKLGDDPLMGRLQPPSFSSEAQRIQQATLVHDFVGQILAADPSADVVVDGDLNDFEWSNAVTTLKGSILHDLIETLPVGERYSYVFEGNSETLDHVLVSGDLFARPFAFDVVHVNAEFADQASDHDPSVARLTLDDPPTASANGPYAVDEGSSVGVTASGVDPEGGPVTYAWDLDANGTFETPGQTATFSAASIDGPATRTIRVRVTDAGGNSTDASATVTIGNVAPAGVFSAPAAAPAGFSFTLSLSGVTDPSTADTQSGFSYAFDCGSGYGAFGAASTASCPTTLPETRSVGAKVRDKDGGTREYRGTVQVGVTYASLAALTRTLVTKAGVAQGLTDKLDGAAASAAAGDAQAAQNQLRAYRNQLDAQSGKSISKADAELLETLSTYL
jgi:predicted extracellular nuclease